MTYFQNNGVPPPAWSTFPLSGTLDHYDSAITTSEVIGDIEDTQKPLQMLVRAPGTFTYLQACLGADSLRQLLIRFFVGGSGPPGGTADLFVAYTPAESMGTHVELALSGSEEGAAGSKVSLTAFDQPVGEGGNTIWSTGVNWKGNSNNSLVDLMCVEAAASSQDRASGFEFVGTHEDVPSTEWVASPFGTFKPILRAAINEGEDERPLSVEHIQTFKMRVSHLRAYMDLNITGSVIRVGLLKNGGTDADLFVDCMAGAGWYEDTGSDAFIDAGDGWCLRFKGEEDNLTSQVAHISTVCLSYFDGNSADRSCKHRDLPEAVPVDPLPCLTRLARSVKLTRRDGQVFAYTEHDEDVEHDGITYLSCGGFQGSASELGAVTGEVGNMDITGSARELGISRSDIFSGKFDGAVAEVWLLPWGEDNDQPARRIAGGTFGKVTQEGMAFTYEALSATAYMKQRALLEVVTSSCRFDLGSLRCTVHLEEMRVTGSITSVAPDDNGTNIAPRRTFTDSERVEADGFFTEGELTILSGANVGQVCKVKAFAAGEFILWEPLLEELQPGDEYSAVPGCDKLAATCKAKFSNYINFGGFEYVPGLDATSQTPSGRMGE